MIKCHYPIYWYASLLNSEIANQDKVEGLIAECKKKGIKIDKTAVLSQNYKSEVLAPDGFLIEVEA